MSDKFKPGDKVRVIGDYGTRGKIVGPHPYGRNHWWVIMDNKKTDYPRLFVNCLELIPEPRKIEGWVVVNRNSGSNSLFPDRTEAEKFSYKDYETVVYVSGTEGIEP